jgi:hypothetical protein
MNSLLLKPVCFLAPEKGAAKTWFAAASFYSANILQKTT